MITWTTSKIDSEGNCAILFLQPSKIAFISRQHDMPTHYWLKEIKKIDQRDITSSYSRVQGS